MLSVWCLVPGNYPTARRLRPLRSLIEDRTIAEKSIDLILSRYLIGHEKVLIRVNPDDIRALEPYHDEFLKSMEETDSLELVESPNISQGGCLVETNLGTIDTQIETQLEQVRRNLNLPGTTSSREQ